MPRKRSHEYRLAGTPVDLMLELAEIFYKDWQPWDHDKCVRRASKIILVGLRERKQKTGSSGGTV